MGLFDFFKKDKVEEPIKPTYAKEADYATHIPDVEARREQQEEYDLRKDLDNEEAHDRAVMELKRKGVLLGAEEEKSIEERQREQEEKEKELFAGFKDRPVLAEEQTHERSR